MLQVMLHPASINDAPALFPIFCNQENVKFTNFKTFEDLISFSLFMEKFLSIEKGGPLQYGPFSINLYNSIIGLCGLQQMDIINGKSELWYLLHRDYWGNGYAKQAVKKLLDLGQKNAGIKTIYAEAVRCNTASWHILERCGFIKISEKRDGFVKGYIKEDLCIYTLHSQP